MYRESDEYKKNHTQHPLPLPVPPTEVWHFNFFALPTLLEPMHYHDRLPPSAPPLPAALHATSAYRPLWHCPAPLHRLPATPRHRHAAWPRGVAPGLPRHVAAAMVYFLVF
jgi:hypothetical protein